MLAFAYGADEPVLNLADASALARLREDPREKALYEAIAAVAILVTGRVGPTLLAVLPGNPEVGRVEGLRRRWQRWARRIPHELQAAVRPVDGARA